MSEPVYPIASFPIDGHLWWLRWFDHPAYDGVTSTYTVAVALSRLPAVARSDDLPVLDAGLVAAAGPQITRRVQTGLIPVLAIGTVYRNGCPVGLLWANPEPFTFERSRCAVEVLAIREPASDDLLPLWAGDRPGLALSRAAYALRGFDDSLCLRISALDGSGRQLVLPCPEVFRSLLAPHRTIALALTNGPWEHTRKQVVHDEGTHVRRGGAWRVALAGGVGPAHAVTISNLILNPVGRRVANEVWAAIITPSKLPRDRERDDARPRPARFGRLRARLPFDWDVLDVTVCGVRPSTVADAWIGLRIVSLTWPPPPKGPPRDVWWVPWKDTRPGATRVPVDEPRPYGGVRETHADEGAGRVLSDVDPSLGSQAVPMEAPGLLWTNPPRLHRASKAVSRIYTGRPRRKRNQETGALSAGNAVPGPTGAATAQARTRALQPGSARFAEVLRMFDRLSRDGSIASYGIVSPGPQDAEHRGRIAAWKCPRPPRGRGRPSLWFRLDLEQEVTRAALVCAVRLDGGTLYWIELELRKNEHGYRSLLFAAGEEALYDAIPALLRIAVRQRGIWPEAEALIIETGVLAAESWTHSQIDGMLNEQRAYKAMQAVIAGTGPPLGSRPD